MKFTFSSQNFLISLTLFFIEVVIALFVRDKFIRPYGGDVLVVVLVYYFSKTFIKTKPIYLTVFTLLFAYFVEFLQYLNFITFIGLQNNKLARVVIGTSFSWGDMVCYTVGFVLILLIDRKQIFN
nr:DUF2809 domain-containing protein [uncultured Flavobacterium sp.]